MAKAPVIKEAVSWYAGTDGKTNYCVGYAEDYASRPTIYKEINNAPIDFETMKSRVALQKQKKEVDTSPTNPGYSESGIVFFTTIGDLTESEIKYKLVDKVKYDEGIEHITIGGHKLSLPKGLDMYRYTFKVNDDGQVLE